MAEDRGPQLAAVLGLFLGLTWISVSLRVYVKAFLTKSWAVDDLLLLLSLICFSAWSACALLGVKYGTGRHTADVPIKDIPKAVYYWWLCEIFYTSTTLFVRLSIARFLLRIAVKPLHRGIIYGTLGTVIVYFTFYFFLIIFQCTPVTFFWGQYEGKKGTCISTAIIPGVSIAHSAVSFTADWILGVLPIFLIYNLQMNFRTKVSVASLLSLGIFAGIAAIIRIPYITVAVSDFLFATTDVAIWSTVESGLGIIAAAGATLRPLFRKFYSLSGNKSSNPNTASKHSKFQNIHKHSNFQNRGQELSVMGRSRHVECSGDSEEIQLKTDVGATGGVGKGGAAVTSNFFADDNEVLYDKGSRGEMGSRWDEIQVHRTVKVTRNGCDSVSTLESEPNSPWPRPGTERSDKDMV